MKQTLLLTLLGAMALTASAEYTGEGYYRVQNYKTTRWITVVDNRGSIDFGSTTADLRAISLIRDFDQVSWDAASILYIIPKGGNNYQIETQGTGIYQIIDHYVQFSKVPGTTDQYYCTGTYKGTVKYISDVTWQNVNVGIAATTGKTENRNWYIKPIDNNGSNYFGLHPTIQADGKNWGTLYGDFPMTPGEGSKFYTVSGTDGQNVYITPVEGTVARAVPVIFECASTVVKENPVAIGGNGTKPADNKLTGVYFCETVNAGHLNYVKYDAATMRVLGTCDDGSLGFVTSNIRYIPANTAYLKVAAGSPEQMKCVVTDAAVGEIKADDNPLKNVWNLQGIQVLRNGTEEDVRNLPSGLYIVNGRKVRL